MNHYDKMHINPAAVPRTLVVLEVGAYDWQEEETERSYATVCKVAPYRTFYFSIFLNLKIKQI